MPPTRFFYEGSADHAYVNICLYIYIYIYTHKKRCPRLYKPTRPKIKWISANFGPFKGPFVGCGGSQKCSKFVFERLGRQLGVQGSSRMLRADAKDEPFGTLMDDFGPQGSILSPRKVPQMFRNQLWEARSAAWGGKKGQKTLPKGVAKCDRKNDRQRS